MKCLTQGHRPSACRTNCCILCHYPPNDMQEHVESHDQNITLLPPGQCVAVFCPKNGENRRKVQFDVVQMMQSECCHLQPWVCFSIQEFLENLFFYVVQRKIMRRNFFYFFFLWRLGSPEKLSFYHGREISGIHWIGGERPVLLSENIDLVFKM